MNFKRAQEFDFMATGEIKRLRSDEREREKMELAKEKIDFTEFFPMTAEQIQSFVLAGKTTESLLCNLLTMKTFQREVDPMFFQILEVHGLSIFGEQHLLRKLLAECHIQHGQAFVNRLIRYIAVFCFGQSNVTEIRSWRELLIAKPEVDWSKGFLHTTGVNDIEMHSLTTLVILFPDTAAQHTPRILSLMAKSDNLPGCFQIFITTCFRSMSASLKQALNKKDVEVMVCRFLRKKYDECVPLTLRNDDWPKINVTQAQKKFTQVTYNITSEALYIIRESDKKSAFELLRNPCLNMERPSNLFIEFFLQFVKLGMFTRWDNKLMAWNYYYDDRWCGYDRQDLFGSEQFELTEMFLFKQSFKYAGTIKQHAHHHNLMLFARSVDWMLDDDELYETLMEKYGDEDFIQYAAISLSFAGLFEKMTVFYEKVKDKMTSKHGFMSLNTCYLYSLAKQGLATQAIIAWSRILDRAFEWEYTETIYFNERSFELPQFVKVKFTAQFATRLLRNCLWTAAMKEGGDGWKKYGLIILNLCETLEKSFLNHNMVRVMFQKVAKEDLHLFFQPGFENCIIHSDTFNHIMTVVDRIDPNLLGKLAEQGIRIPSPDEYPKKRCYPGYLAVFEKLKSKNEIFSHVIDDLPEEVFVSFKITETTVTTPQKTDDDSEGVDDTSVVIISDTPENCTPVDSEDDEDEFDSKLDNFDSSSQSSPFANYPTFDPLPVYDPATMTEEDRVAYLDRILNDFKVVFESTPQKYLSKSIFNKEKPTPPVIRRQDYDYEDNFNNPESENTPEESIALEKNYTSDEIFSPKENVVQEEATQKVYEPEKQEKTEYKHRDRNRSQKMNEETDMFDEDDDEEEKVIKKKKRQPVDDEPDLEQYSEEPSSNRYWDPFTKNRVVNEYEPEIKKEVFDEDDE